MSFLIRPSRRFPVCSPVTYIAGLFLRLPLTYFWGFWLLITLLLLSSATAYADWVALGTTDDGMTTYADPDTIRRKGDLVKMWALYDFKTIRTVEDISYLSYMVQREYDCAEERIRYLAFTFFSGNIGSRKVVPTTSDEQQKSEPVQPDSISQTLFKVACAKQ